MWMHLMLTIYLNDLLLSIAFQISQFWCKYFEYTRNQLPFCFCYAWLHRLLFFNRYLSVGLYWIQCFILLESSDNDHWMKFVPLILCFILDTSLPIWSKLVNLCSSRRSTVKQYFVTYRNRFVFFFLIFFNRSPFFFLKNVHVDGYNLNEKLCCDFYASMLVPKRIVVAALPRTCYLVFTY